MDDKTRRLIEAQIGLVLVKLHVARAIKILEGEESTGDADYEINAVNNAIKVLEDALEVQQNSAQ